MEVDIVHAHIVHSARVRKEIISCREIQLVDELYFLCPGACSVLEVTYLRFEIVAETEVEPRSLAFSRYGIELPGVDVVVLCPYVTVLVCVCQCPPSVEICAFLGAEIGTE